MNLEFELESVRIPFSVLNHLPKISCFEFALFFVDIFFTRLFLIGFTQVRQFANNILAFFGSTDFRTLVNFQFSIRCKVKPGEIRKSLIEINCS